MLLVPADVLHPRRPDEHFAAEAAAAREIGIDVAIVDHDALTRPDGYERAVARVTGTGIAVYRGWMLRSEQYAAFAQALAQRGVTLRTNPAEYRTGHEFPGWYPALTPVTPSSAWTVGDGREEFDRARTELGGGPAVLRDYTKSMKHHWHEAAFIPDLADAAAAWTVASRFRELRGDDFVGGVDLATAGPLVSSLRLPFVTVDFARRSDGVWRVIELGDGQVSDRPTSTPVDIFVTALALDDPSGRVPDST